MGFGLLTNRGEQERRLGVVPTQDRKNRNGLRQAKPLRWSEADDSAVPFGPPQVVTKRTLWRRVVVARASGNRCLRGLILGEGPIRIVAV